MLQFESSLIASSTATLKATNNIGVGLYRHMPTGSDYGKELQFYSGESHCGAIEVLNSELGGRWSGEGTP